MLEPKKTLVGLAGQKAWHIWAGEAAPRISGKYLPSQLRTQKAGPELTTTGRGGGDCGLLLDEVCCCCFWPPPKKKSSKPSAALISGVSATGAKMVPATSMRPSLRRKDNSVCKACSTGRNGPFCSTKSSLSSRCGNRGNETRSKLGEEGERNRRVSASTTFQPLWDAVRGGDPREFALKSD